MSKQPEKKSDAASGQAANDSVFDFLYHDPQRIASFLAQFDPYGVVQSLKRTHQLTNQSTESSKDQVGVNLGLVKGALGADASVSEASGDGSEKTYDPLWSNARAFLDYIEQHQLLHRNLGSSRIGHIALVTGDLWVTDMSLLKSMLSNTLLKKAVRSGLSPTQKATPTGGVSEADLIFEFLPILPHSIQGSVVDILGKHLWFTLKADGLSTSAGDIFLKHGAKIPGGWSVVGIVDALPANKHHTPSASPFVGGMQKVIADMSSSIRPGFGRPDHAWGITPLLIFREVTATGPAATPPGFLLPGLS